MKSNLKVILFLGLLNSVGGQAHTPGCDPQVKKALDEASLQGVQRSTEIIHKTYARPASTLDLSCLDKYMNGLKGLSFLLDPSSLLGNLRERVQNQICEQADRLWDQKRQRFETLTPEALFQDIPGVEVNAASYDQGGKLIQTDIRSPSSEVELVLPKVLGKELPPFPLKDLLR